MDKQSTTKLIKKKAQEIGFDLVGITPALPHKDLPFFDQWIQQGRDASMTYLQRRRDDRADPRRLLENAKSIICCGMNYYGGEPKSIECDDPERGWISRYAWGDDYHDIVLAKLKELEDFIRQEIDETAELKAYVDTGPILERSYAASAGLGWIGKNTLLINRQQGSYFFIGEILCSLDLAPDTPETDHCGHCQLCIDHCPTDAIAPYELDSNRCIAYLTIEHRGDIATEFHEAIGQHVVGCDICQEVCPWNKAPALSQEPRFKPREGLLHPRLSELAQLDETAFREKFRKSPIKRVKAAGLQRNTAIVQKNQQKPRNAGES